MRSMNRSHDVVISLGFSDFLMLGKSGNGVLFYDMS